MKKFALVALIVALIAGSLGGWALANENDSEAEAPQTQEQALAPGWLGLTIAPTQKQLAWWLNQEDIDGVLVLKVDPDSPAEAAGVLPKDIITVVTIGEQTLEEAGQMVAALKRVKAGDEVVLTILREGSQQQITVVAVERPQPSPPCTRVFPELEGIAPQELFEHFTGGELGFTDAEGNAHTVIITPGILEELGDGYVKITPTGQEEAVTFNTTDDTIIRPEDLEPESRVIVVSVDNSAEARAVLGAGVRAWLNQFCLQGQMVPRFRGQLPELKGNWELWLGQLPPEVEERLQDLSQQWPQLKERLRQCVPPEVKERLGKQLPQLRERFRQHVLPNWQRGNGGEVKVFIPPERLPLLETIGPDTA